MFSLAKRRCPVDKASEGCAKLPLLATAVGSDVHFELGDESSRQLISDASSADLQINAMTPVQEKTVGGALQTVIDMNPKLVDGEDETRESSKRTLLRYLFQQYHKGAKSIKEFVSEFMGTFMLISFGIAANCSYSFAPWAGDNWMVIALGWGLALFFGILFGKPSGAHLNPAVTLKVAVFDGFEWGKVPGYMFAQFLGSTAAGFFDANLFRQVIIDYNTATGEAKHNDPAWMENEPWFQSGANDTLTNHSGAFVTGSGMTLGMAAATETFQAIVLSMVLCFVGDLDAPAYIIQAIVSLIIVAIGTSFGGLTGYAMNPIRDFPQRLVVSGMSGDLHTFEDWYWVVPLLVPFAGILMGASLYNCCYKSPKNINEMDHKAVAADLQKQWEAKIKGSSSSGIKEESV